jgi:hypothetical protein
MFDPFTSWFMAEAGSYVVSKLLDGVAKRPEDWANDMANRLVEALPDGSTNGKKDALLLWLEDVNTWDALVANSPSHVDTLVNGLANCLLLEQPDAKKAVSLLIGGFLCNLDASLATAISECRRQQSAVAITKALAEIETKITGTTYANHVRTQVIVEHVDQLFTGDNNQVLKVDRFTSAERSLQQKLTEVRDLEGQQLVRADEAREIRMMLLQQDLLEGGLNE